MDFKNKVKSNLSEMAQIIKSKNDPDISTMNLVMENGKVNENAIQRLDALVNKVEKDVDELNLEQQSYKEQGVNSMMQDSTIAEFGFSPRSIPLVGRFFSKYEVQIYIPIQTSTSEHLSSAISTLCEDISLKCILCNGSGQLQRKVALVVVCPISSRFEPDIDLALNGIEYKEPFIALVLHSGLESSLPRLPTSTKLANRGKYQNIEFIDIAFTFEAKLCKCQMNESAKHLLKTFVNKFYKK